MAAAPLPERNRISDCAEWSQERWRRRCPTAAAVGNCHGGDCCWIARDGPPARKTDHECPVFRGRFVEGKGVVCFWPDIYVRFSGRSFANLLSIQLHGVNPLSIVIMAHEVLKTGLIESLILGLSLLCRIVSRLF
jgi:hypothetical protein